VKPSSPPAPFLAATLRAVAAALAVLLSAPALAQVAVSEPWVRGTVPGQRSSGAFMTLISATDERLVEARSPVAGVVEIHEMAMDGNVMRMRPVSSIELPANKPVTLAPGGYHVMLMELTQSLKAGDSVPLTLIVEGADRRRRAIEIKATVRALNAGAGAGTAKPTKD
jgi:copper(I)-binding protein